MKNSAKLQKLVEALQSLMIFREQILSVMNCDRFSHFQPFTHYNTTWDTTQATECRNEKNVISNKF